MFFWELIKWKSRFYLMKLIKWEGYFLNIEDLWWSMPKQNGMSGNLLGVLTESKDRKQRVVSN